MISEKRLPTLLSTIAFQPGLVILRGWAGDVHKGSAPPDKPWTVQNQEQIWGQARVSVSVWHPFSSPFCPQAPAKWDRGIQALGFFTGTPSTGHLSMKFSPMSFRRVVTTRVKIDQRTPNRQSFSTLPLTGYVTLGKWTIISVIYLKNGAIFVLLSWNCCES